MTGNAPRRSWIPDLLLVAQTAAILILAVTLPRFQDLYQKKSFTAVIQGLFWVAAVFAIIALVRSFRKHLLIRLVVLAASALALYQVSTSVFGTNPDRASAYRELFHLLEYFLLGLIFYFAFRRRISGAALFVWGAIFGHLVGVADETLQWWHPLRVGEWRDILVNLKTSIICQATLGAYLLLPERARFTTRSIPPLLGGVAAALLASGLFLASFETVQVIKDSDIGVFYSRFDREQLLARARLRAERWSREGRGFLMSTDPASSSPFARDDSLAREAREHLHKRNFAVTAGYARRAWSENMILERYYYPYLDHAPGRLGKDHPARTLAPFKNLQSSSFESTAFSDKIKVITREQMLLLFGALSALLMIASVALKIRLC